MRGTASEPRHRSTPAFRALLIGMAGLAALLGAGCSDDDGDGDAATRATDPEAQAEVDAAIPEPNTARISTATGREEDVVLNECVAQSPGNLQLSGSTDDGSTLEVQIGEAATDVAWGRYSGTDVTMSNDPSTRSFQITGLLEPTAPGEGDPVPMSFTIVGRCPD